MPVNGNSAILLRAILVLVGAGIIFLGLNVGFGGIKTLGWQGETDFISVVKDAAYGSQDNHVRFLGGFWLGAGLLFVAGGVAFKSLRRVLIAITGMIFIGGLARVSVFDPAILLSSAIAPSLVAELFLFPMLGLWIARSKPQ